MVVIGQRAWQAAGGPTPKSFNKRPRRLSGAQETYSMSQAAARAPQEATPSLRRRAP
jgi:hypothetical protein